MLTDAAPMVMFEGVGKSYPNAVTALDDVSFAIPRGRITALMGASGSGKTTLLKLINRIEEPSRGSIVLDGKAVAERDIIALRREVGYVIQEGGLFPHWTAERNVALVPTLIGAPPAERDRMVAEAMAKARIPRAEFGFRYPDELSGGQRQRVAMARAIAARPRLLLLDEPFAALDPPLRAELHGELRSLVQDLGITAVIVTHDIAEAFTVGDRIILLDQGRIVQAGTPAQIALEPADTVAAAFTARQALELRLRYLRLADIAPYLRVADGEAGKAIDGARTVADALGEIARSGADRFAVASSDRNWGPFERRDIWRMLEQGTQ